MKYIKHLLLSLGLVAAAVQPVSAQQTIPAPKFERGYIELKDGRIVKGRYLYATTLDRIRIVTADSSFVTAATDVVRITRKRPTPLTIDAHTIETPPATAVRKYYINASVGLLAGNPKNRVALPLTFHAAIGYRLSDRLSLGIGTGFEFYSETYMPLMLQTAYRFTDRPVAPFVALRAGWLMPIGKPKVQQTWIHGPGTDIYRYYPRYAEILYPLGGGFIDPSVGIVHYTRSGLGLTFAAGYRFHQLRYRNNPLEYDLRNDWNRLSLQAGIIF